LRARVSIEAGVGTGWQKYVGDNGEIISLEHFGASASAGTLFKEYGFTAENIVAAAKRTIARA
jgi:transketolase